MEIPPSQEKERSDWVLVLLICYGFGVVINSGIILFLLLTSKSGQLDLIGIGILVTVIALRGVGLVRLYYFKSDAWLYLSLALFILVANDALDLIIGGTNFFLQRHSIPPIISSVVGGLVVIIYAFNVSNKRQESDRSLKSET